MEGAIEDLDKWFLENRDELSSSVKAFSDTMQQIDNFMGSANETNLICSIKEATENFNENMKLMKSSLEEIERIAFRNYDTIEKLMCGIK